jgi:hypothetical protein
MQSRVNTEEIPEGIITLPRLTEYLQGLKVQKKKKLKLSWGRNDSNRLMARWWW